MRALIIAAGAGKRIGRFAEELPKSLIDINGKSILENQISLFRKNYINDIVVITGPYKEKFKFENLTYVNDSDFPKHDILESLMAAKNYINDEVLIIYSDIVFEESILLQILESNADVGIAIDLDWQKNYIDSGNSESEAENVLLDNTGKIEKIRKNIQSEKGKVGEFIGIMKLSSKGSDIFVNKFAMLKNSHSGTFHTAPSLQKAYLTDMIQELVDSKITVTPIFVSGKWCEIDTVQDLQRARKLFS